MCDLCSIEARSPYLMLGETFFLAEAGQNCPRLGVSQNEWVLVAPGPAIVGNFGSKLRPDPTYGKSDEEIDLLGDEDSAEMWAWMEDMGEFHTQLRMIPEQGAALVGECEKLGYTSEQGHLAGWLYHHAGSIVSRRKAGT